VVAQSIVTRAARGLQIAALLRCLPACPTNGLGPKAGPRSGDVVSPRGYYAMPLSVMAAQRVAASAAVRRFRRV